MSLAEGGGFPGLAGGLRTRALDLRGRVLWLIGCGLQVEAGHLVVREVFPELAAGLLAEGGCLPSARPSPCLRLRLW